MKRSHMVTIIAECLVEPHYPDDAVKEADYILRRIQRYGMMAPLGKFKDPGHFTGDQFEYSQYDWEPEDET